jgi:putative addiction module component (TIGR02574 family)
MSKALERIEDEALKLPARLRARLARRLILSLEEEPVEPNPEREWMLEIERRSSELRSGKVKGIPAGKVFRKAHSALR